MKENAMLEKYEEVALFGNPALFTNSRIDRASVPEGWYCYDLRGSDDDPGYPISVEPFVFVNHVGTILTHEPALLPKDEDFRSLGEEDLLFFGREYTLPEFSDVYGLPASQSRPIYEFHPVCQAQKNSMQMGGM